MGTFIHSLYFCLIILSCHGESEFQNSEAQIYVSKPSGHHTFNYSSVTKQQTLQQSLGSLQSTMKNVNKKMTDRSKTLESLNPLQNRSSILNSTDYQVDELYTQKHTEIMEVMDSSKDQPLLNARMSLEPRKHNLHEEPVLKLKAVDHRKHNDTPSPSVAMKPEGCGISMNGILDLSNRNLSEKELRATIESGPCWATLDKIQVLNASHNNLEGDLIILILLFLNMKNVRAIDLSCNNLTFNAMCAEEIQDLEESKLIFLNLSHNPLKTLSDLCLPQSLKGIDLSFTQIDRIPQEFAILFSNMEEIYLQGNQFVYTVKTLQSVLIGDVGTSSVSYVDLPKHSLIESLPHRVKHLVLSNCSIVELPEWFAQKVGQLLFLDLSNNPMNSFPGLPTTLQRLDLSNSNIKAMANLKFISNLTVVNIPNNKIEDISPKHVPYSLEEFDISKNKIRRMPFLGAHSKLKSLNISGNVIMQLNVNTSHPSLSNLDASHNLITELHDEMGTFLPELKFLNLSGNKISFLQPGSLPESLLELDISNNAITIIMEETFGRLRNLRVLMAQGKHFFCNCDLYWFANTYLASPNVQIHGREALKCSFPLQKRGLLVENSNLTILYCSLGLQMGITAIVAAMFMTVITVLCWRFHGPWYIKMGWYWCMAKRKQYQKSPEDKLYDAFVSYSENDAPWTKEILLKNLEANNYRVCYHERDFLPGHPVLGNIFHCIENSHKVLFVLSPSFVNSCWCQYELYFAEHRVLNENQDSLIMIVLEDLPPNSVPQKFSKLRKLLKRKTYLKWSSEEHKQKLFWCQLNAVLKTTNEPMVLDETIELH
nr:PREDICTED: toll-like receptor 2 [Anolis carolinensis]|eukprot:XP_008100955.2 PREDICTED: toll-like receptor 2 [Anolis carolinensis]